LNARTGALISTSPWGVHATSIDETGSRIATTEYAGPNAVWEVDTWEPACTGLADARLQGAFAGSEPILSPDGRHVAMSADDALILWDCSSGSIKSKVPLRQRGSTSVIKF